MSLKFDELVKRNLEVVANQVLSECQKRSVTVDVHMPSNVNPLDSDRLSIAHSYLDTRRLLDDNGPDYRSPTRYSKTGNKMQVRKSLQPLRNSLRRSMIDRVSVPEHQSEGDTSEDKEEHEEDVDDMVNPLDSPYPPKSKKQVIVKQFSLPLEIQIPKLDVAKALEPLTVNSDRTDYNPNNAPAPVIDMSPGISLFIFEGVKRATPVLSLTSFHQLSRAYEPKQSVHTETESSTLSLEILKSQHREPTHVEILAAPILTLSTVFLETLQIKGQIKKMEVTRLPKPVLEDVSFKVADITGRIEQRIASLPTPPAAVLRICDLKELVKIEASEKSHKRSEEASQIKFLPGVPKDYQARREDENPLCDSMSPYEIRTPVVGALASSELVQSVTSIDNKHLQQMIDWFMKCSMHFIKIIARMSTVSKLKYLITE